MNISISKHLRAAIYGSVYLRLACCLVIVAPFILCATNLAAGELSYSGQISKDASLTGNSAAGAGNSCVSLYTGQHAEIFPLVSLPTHGLGDIEITLGYSGNVRQTAMEENKVSSASWVGLGFELSTEYIFVDDKGTVSIADDDYFYSSGGGKVKLIPSESETGIYYPSNGNLWRIQRSIVTIGDYQYIIGWIIIKENGIVYKYGDFDTDFSVRNATWYQLHWGNHLAIGASDGDLLYPFRWDISKIENGNNKWVNYEYIQIDEKIQVFGNPTYLTQNSYTQASYPHKISSSLGYSIEFIIADREDYQDYYGLAQYEYYQTKRLSSLVSYYKDNPISYVNLNYDYIGEGLNPNKKKLILTEISTCDSSNSRCLPPTMFSYYTDKSSLYYGSIEKITSPQGGVKKIIYDVLDSTKILMKLNTGGNIAYDERPCHAYSSSVMIRKYRLINDNPNQYRFDIGAFDGYWHITQLSDIIDSEKDSCIASGDDWVVLYKHELGKFIVLNHNSGQWARDTINQNWVGGVAHNVRIDAGNNYFIACDIMHNGSDVKIRRAYLYKKDNGLWTEYLLFDDLYYNNNIVDVKLGLDLYAIRIQNGANAQQYKIYYGKYDYSNKFIVINSTNGWIDNIIYDVGVDIVAYGGMMLDPYHCHAGDLVSEITISSFESNNWSDTSFSVTGLRSLITVSSGVIINSGFIHGHPDYIDCFFQWEDGRVKWLMRDESGWTCDSLYVGYDDEDPVLRPLTAAGGNSFVLIRNRIGMDPDVASDWYNDAVVLEWNGIGWDSTVVASIISNNTKVLATGEICILYQRYNSDSPNDFGYLSASHNLGHGTWSPAEVLNDNMWIKHIQEFGYTFGDAYIQAAGKIIVACDDKYDDGLQRFLYTWDESDQKWDTLDLVQYTCDPSPVNSFYAYPWVFNGRFFIKDHGAPTNYVDRGFYCFQKCQDTYLGSPLVVVVKQVKKYPEGPNSTPVIVDFDYDGGILDAGANTPRFARASISTPYYEGVGNGPNGYSISYYYNDLDDNDFQDPYGDGTLILPDLQDEGLYGEPNGGYLLDGYAYLVYDSSLEESSQDLPHDAVNYYYSLKKFTNHSDASPRIQLDSTSTLTKGVQNTVSYTYDAYGRAIRTVSPLFDNKTSITDLTYYDFPIALNVYDRLAIMAKSYDSLGNSQPVSRTHQVWRVVNSEVFPNYTIIYPNAGLYGSGSYIYPYVEMTQDGRDDWGNLICWRGVDGDTSAIKYSPDGTQKIAEIAHAHINNVFIFGAEYDFDQENIGYDGWENLKPSLNTINSLIVFDGNRSLKIIDDAASNENNPGIERVLYPDSVFRQDYILSFWAKSNCQVKGAIGIIYESLGRTVFTEPHPGDNEWHKLECIINLSDYEYNNLSLMDIGIFMMDYDGGIAYIDDVRFNPSDASVITKTYDTITGLEISVSDKNNIPIRTEYDNFGRVHNVINHSGQLLKTYNYGWSKPIVLKEEEAVLENETGIDQSVFEITHNQEISYTLSCEVYGQDAIEGYAAIYVNGDQYDIVEIDMNHLTTSSGQISVEETNIIKVKVFATAGNVSMIALSASVQFSEIDLDGPYQPEKPNYTKTNIYKGDNRYSSIINFSDGFGRTLQNRTYVNIDNEEHAIVSDATVLNARGQVLKRYKPYIDIISPYGINNFSSASDIINESSNYYNGEHDVDLEGVTYYENKYTNDVKSKVSETAKPGSTYSIASGNTYKMDRFRSIESDGDDTIFVCTTLDPDGVKRAEKTHARGKFTKSVSFFKNNSNVLDSISVCTYKDILGQSTQVFIDTGGTSSTAEIHLKTSWKNDFGLDDSTYQVDYGITRMQYDEMGNLRFLQNDGFISQNQFIYFKYDVQGRKIEEGVMGSASQYIFNQEVNYAYDNDFPMASDGPIVKYRWYYDYYVGDDSVIVSIGDLVRVENGTATYYKEYYYYKDKLYDIVLTKLPIDGESTIKGVKHEYNLDRTINRTTFYPDWSNQLDFRDISYDYDEIGRLCSLKEEGIISGKNLTHAEFGYNANSNLVVNRLGIYDNDVLGIHDTAQVLYYYYDSRGKLTGINNPADVVASYMGGASSTHFGMHLEYYESGQNDYLNGRVSSIFSSTSGGAQIVNQDYNYVYNDLGWLIAADNLNNDNYDKSYVYNRLGNRSSIMTNGNTVDYSYDPSLPGSSRLISCTGMSSEYKYDIIGNLIADTSHGVFVLEYDYRDLINYAKFNGAQAPGYQDALYFSYDELGQRIEKYYKYKYWDECEDIIIPSIYSAYNDSVNTFDLMTLESIGPSPILCLHTGHEKTFYLYDGEELIATYDNEDNITEYFVNGPNSMIASYRSNDDSQLHYYIGDQINSNRIVMHSPQDGSGPMLVEYTNYHPFGQIQACVGSFHTPFKYSGKEFDDHGAFEYSYFGSRYYNADIGRFSSVDHMGQFSSGYVYCGNNPISLSDPDGNLAVAVAAVLEAAGAIMRGYGYLQLYMSSTQVVSQYRNNNGSFDLYPLAMFFSNYVKGYGLSKIGQGLTGKTAGIKSAVMKSTIQYIDNDNPNLISPLYAVAVLVATEGATEYDKWRASKKPAACIVILQNEYLEYFKKGIKEAKQSIKDGDPKEAYVTGQVNEETGEFSLLAQELTDREDGGQIKNETEKGYKHILTWHTHLVTNNLHSPKDMASVTGGRHGDFSFVETGKELYVIVVTDLDQAKTFDLDSEYNRAKKELLELHPGLGYNLRGNEESWHRAAVIRMINYEGSGMKIFKANKNRTEFKEQ
ncbi:MAG: RHS repeat-associated core domain-containing protein [Candidatus Zixiibacteriota bacterium]